MRIWGGLVLGSLLSVMVCVVPLMAKTVVAPYYGERASGANRNAVRLSGTIRGTYSIQQAVPDVGKGYNLLGSGNVRPLGSVQASGNLHSLGFIASGNARGRLTLHSAGGSVTLALVGPPQRGFGPLPSHFQYAITAASGTYRMATARGSIRLVLRQEMRQDANGEVVITFLR